MLDHFLTNINALLPEPQASLLAGMLFGVRRTMPDNLHEALIVTGTLHVVALSGMNISIIIRVLTGMFIYLFGKVAGLFLTLAGILSFVLLVGPSETIVRASIMGSLSLVAMAFGRKDIPLLSLIFAVVIMITINSEVVSSLSFQLSVFATLGIILFGGGEFLRSSIEDESPSLFPRILSSLRRFSIENFRVTLAAQIFTAPLILFYFNRLSLISPFANVAVGWLVAPITYLGFIAVLFSEVWWPLGRLAGIVVWVPLSLFISIVETFSQMPYASVEF